MTKTKTVTEQTIHGSIEYDVVECDSCGQDVMEDEANEFVIGDREGYACDVCAKEGPAGFPVKDYSVDLESRVMLTIAWPFLAALVLLAGTEDFEELEWWIDGSLGGILWATLITTVINVFYGVPL